MVSGALMCIDSGLFGAGLNTLLPMYLEDQEICMRSLAEGHLIMLYPPDLVAVHAGGVSRKSLTDHDRALRIMELVEAPPVQCMARLQGYSALSLRLTVFLGGISRIVAAFFLAASFKVFLLRRGGSNQVAWMLEQQRLGLWFALWAIKGAIHDEEVSLSDYFFGVRAEALSFASRPVTPTCAVLRQAPPDAPKPATEAWKRHAATPEESFRLNHRRIHEYCGNTTQAELEAAYYRESQPYIRSGPANKSTALSESICHAVYKGMGVLAADAVQHREEMGVADADWGHTKRDSARKK